MDRGDSGVFIAIEGIDGAGTTTQMERYAAHLRSLKRAVHTTREPSTGPIGSLIRLMLTERVSLPSARHAETMALLFAADRLDHVECEISPLLRDGCVVLSDRYDLSSIIYQSVAADVPPPSTRDGAPVPRANVPWIRELNRFAKRPDVTLVVDVSPDVAAARRKARGGPKEIFDDQELQKRLAAAYRNAESFVPEDRVVHVNGDGRPEDVTQAIIAALAAYV
jgi:dTMP kinase